MRFTLCPERRIVGGGPRVGGRARGAGAALRRRRICAAARQQLAPLRLPAAGAAQQLLAAGGQGSGRRAWRGPGGPLSCCSAALSWTCHPGFALIPKPCFLRPLAVPQTLNTLVYGLPLSFPHLWKVFEKIEISSVIPMSFRVRDPVECSIYVSDSLGICPITAIFLARALNPVS